jgi:hypothetical protein
VRLERCDAAGGDEAEPPGASACIGGEKIATGVDDDLSGTLDEVEIDRISYECRAEKVFEGDLVIRTESDLPLLEHVNRIAGSLTLDAPAVLIDLSSLMRVEGAFTTDCRGHNVDALAAIGGDLVLRCQRQTSGDTTAVFLALVELGGGIVFGDRLTVLRLRLVLPRVTRVDFIRAVPAVPWIENGPIHIGSLEMASLVTIEGDLDFSYTKLMGFILPALQSASFIRFVENDSLCTSAATALAAQTGAPNEITNNKTCP